MARTAPLLLLVRSRCREKGWTFAEAAQHAGISVAGLRKLCAGLVEAPQGPTVRGVAYMLGKSPSVAFAAIAASRAGK